MVFSGQQSEEEVGKYISEKTFQELEKSPKAYVGKVIREPYDKYVDANQGPKLLAYTKGGLLPVLALLALGWSFAWVKRGFQRNVGA